LAEVDDPVKANIENNNNRRGLKERKERDVEEWGAYASQISILKLFNENTESTTRYVAL